MTDNDRSRFPTFTDNEYLAKHTELDNLIGNLYVFVHKLPIDSRLHDTDIDVAHLKIKDALHTIRKLVTKINTN